MPDASLPVKATCHCGNVKFELNQKPEWLTQCNCSICSKLGALWAHAAVKNVKLTMADDATTRYIRGDKTLAFHTCKTCGCTTHWQSLKKNLTQDSTTDDDQRMAVNMALLDPKDVAKYRIRHFDGADSWKFLD